jgi:crotonobetainyl-CoA:carnitine CoA-transferase CaiB-like acyl-CoA transferase
MSTLPLNGLTVLEFSQYLSGPSAGLRLADLGARVIKIERPGTGDACRQLSIGNQWVDESSLLFHTINRNKQSFAADLKNKKDLDLVKILIRNADVMTHNFRPGVMEKIGLDYASVKELNPKMIYGEITGYGKEGPWKERPGQDLLIQSLSGLTFTTGNGNDDPVPMGLAVADMICGTQLVQGILASLIKSEKTGEGAHVEVSLMESILDFQFEFLTTYFASGQLPQRSDTSNAHSLLGAPYGIYQTSNGYIALAMMPIRFLNAAIHCESLNGFTEEDIFSKRDEIKKIIADFLLKNTTEHWLEMLIEKDLWAMPVMNWNELSRHEAYQALDMEQCIDPYGGNTIITTRCPIRINGKILKSETGAPKLGQHNQQIMEEMREKVH